MAQKRSPPAGTGGLFSGSMEITGSGGADLALTLLVALLGAGLVGDGGMLRVAGGNDQLATALAATLTSPIHLRTVLRRVRIGRTGVTVIVDSPTGRVEIRADALICTLPPVPLRRVIFEPGLPGPQQQAIRRLFMGPATRMMLQFSSPFWRPK